MKEEVILKSMEGVREGKKKKNYWVKGRRQDRREGGRVRRREGE